MRGEWVGGEEKQTDSDASARRRDQSIWSALPPLLTGQRMPAGPIRMYSDLRRVGPEPS